jgi:GDP-4-dehydro-6-deoxy-D-mannose reductase
VSKVLITGITGFAGSHLAEYLLIEGHEVYGIARWRSKTENINHIMDKVKLLNADIRDGYSLQKVFKEVNPDYCFHLAAQSFVLESWNSPIETLSTNILGTTNVLEAIRLSCPECKVVIAGSSEEYGLVYLEELPITEKNPLRPMSPYGVSKVATDKLGILYYMSYGLRVVVTRAFNHTGPRRGEVFATSNFAKQIVEIEKDLTSPIIKVGNLDSCRDFTDVRDVAKAYWLAAVCPPGEVYNICSGKAISIKDMLNILLGMSKVKITVEKDKARMRPSDIPILLGDCSKFHLATDWSPKIPFEKTLEDLLNYWREKV